MGIRFLTFWCFFLLLSCGKPSSETMQKRWVSTQEDIKEVVVLYPTFKGVIDQTKKKAAASWELALKESDPEKQVDMMIAAHDQLRQTYVDQLIDMPVSIDRLRDKITRSINTNDMNRFELNSLSTLRSEASYTITQVQNRLMNAQVTSEDEATLLMATLTNQLYDAQRGIEKLISSVKKRVQSEKQKAKEEMETGPSEKSTNSIVKCSHCGSKNSSSKTTCSQCGAPLN